MPNKYLKILWDPGHGGSDPGACNDDLLQAPLLIQEKDITLSLVNLAMEYAKATFVNLINETTRPDDRFVSLSNRVKLCWPKFPDLFFSVHINSRPKALPEVKGTEFESYYWQGLSSTADSAIAAKLVLEHVVLETTLHGQVVVNRGVKTANFFVLRSTPCLSILIEAGFASDKDDVYWFSHEEHRKLIAKGMVDGVVAYFKTKGETVERWN